MHTKSDAELLRDYAANKSEAAFGEIVRRYADFVYSAALRQMGSPEPARDVAQMVFADLARKAGSLAANTLLIGWLCRGARLASLEQLRRDRRRLHRERQAMESQEPASEVANDWDDVRPVLDEAIASLGDEERHALLLRFFKNESFTSVGATLGVSEDAAQKRVSRALGKLREFLEGRGIDTTAAALSVALAANAVQAAPSGFAASLTVAALTKAAAGSSTAPFSKLLTMTNMKTAIVILALDGGIAGLAYQHLNTQRQLHRDRASAEQQAEEIQALRLANEQLVSQTNELTRLREEAKDVLRLRAEIARLRQQQAELKRTAARIAQSETNDLPKIEGPPILIEARFISVPTENLRAFAWSPKMPSGGVELMDDAQVGARLQVLEKVAGMEILQSPRVQTANGVEARLSATEQVPFGGTNANVGVKLNVNPRYSTNSSAITLDLGAELSQLVDTSLQQDESQRDLRITTITNSVTVSDGESILLREDLAGEGRVIGSTNLIAGPKSLLVFLTPHILHDDGSFLRSERIVKIKDVNQ